MSKPSTKPALPSRSAWLRGPPQSTQTPSRSQSPAPPSHSRRPSTLGQGVPIKDGVTIPRGNASAIKQGKCSVVTFGSIDDDSAQISSSPAAAPTLKSENVKSFGSLLVSTPPAQLNGKPSRPTAIPPSPAAASPPPPPQPPSRPAQVDIKKLFQNPSSGPPSSAPSDTSSPSLRPSSLPPQPPPGSHSYQPFVPSAGRPPASAPRPPSSPSYPRQIPNGTGPRPPGPPNPGSSQIPSALSSPRMPPPHPHPGPPPSAMQMPVPGWPGYYYPEQQQYIFGWYTPPPPPPPPPPGPQIPGPPHHQPPHPGPHGPPHNGIPMSPHSQPPPLQPATPTQAHAVPHQPPHSHSHSASAANINFTSPPPTPSTATTRLSANSSTFVPGNRTKIVLKNPDGLEVDINSITSKSNNPSASPSPGPPRAGLRQPSPSSPVPTPRRPTSIRLESEEQRLKRLAEEEKKKEESTKAKAEAEEKARKEKEEKEREEKERIHKEEEERRIKKQEEDRIKKEQEERKKREEEERIKREEEEEEKQRQEEEKKAKEEAERKAKEEEERKAKEEEEQERKAKEEADRKQKEEEEEEKERIRLEAEAEKERLRLEEEEEAAAAKAKAEAEEAPAAAAAAAAESAEEANEQEDGEVVETQQEAPASESTKEALRVNTADLPKRPRPGALNLTDANITNEKVPVALPSALSMAKSITNFNDVSYPEGIQSPDPNLNRELLRYDRPFLLQFMEVCKEKPEGLPDLVTMGLEPNGSHMQENFSMSRGGSGRHKNTASVPSRQGSLGLGISGFPKPGQSMFPTMGNFGSGPKLTSDERFAAASRAVSGGAYGRPSPMTRTSSQGGVGGTPMSNNRVRSKRGEKRGEGNKAGRDGYGHGQSGASQLPAESVAPLEVSANRWDRKAIGAKDDQKALVDRKVKALLNKLTMEKFDSISDQIVEWANKSDGDNDGKTLMQVIALVFEKATDEATWSEMYARLCRKMMEKLSPNVKDESIKLQNGQAIAGGQLFRKYLLNRCQEEFEHGWAVKEATAAAAAKKAAEDQAVKAANEKEGNTEVALYSDEYYAAQKAKRRGLGLIKFIGELFKLQMLTERIMHTCLKKLLGNVDQPEEEDLESCCKLLMTIGSMLDSPKAANHMMAYFSRITELRSSPLVSSRVQFMLQDVLDLREKKWVSRNIVAAPTTIAQVHENVAKEKAAQEKDAYSRQISMSRGGSRRGGNRDDNPQVGPDGWAVAGGNAPRPPPKAGDLSNFGKINKNMSMSFGPSTVFSKKGGDNKRESVSRSSSSSNMFSMLSQGDMSQAEPKAPEPQRKRLVLAPRTKPTADEMAAKSESEAEAESEAEPSAVELTEEQATKKIEEDLKEFFAVRNLDEAEVYLTNLPAVHHFRLIDKFTSRAIESKEAEAQLLAEFFKCAVEKELVTSEAFEAGFLPIAEIIDDVAIDAPKAFTYFATVVKSAGLDDERKVRLASKSLDEQKLLDLLS
ncbi:hypothetical protein C0995_011920 [Termitomyces sp. Mi166|nr:hypothetical protein C0995_011920 [Termitomyces sp. Mi166\